eukprot:11215229-Lingulodinium_polyedra.AAC.1
MAPPLNARGRSAHAGITHREALAGNHAAIATETRAAEQLGNDLARGNRQIVEQTTYALFPNTLRVVNDRPRARS